MKASLPWAREDLSGKTCLITGATDGIGFVTARELARGGADVVLLCRSARRGDEACARIERVAPVVRVRVEVCDLAAQGEIRAAAARLIQRHPEIHILVNNAGTFSTTREETVDGFERTFAVNHLAPFLLTALLRPVLEAGRARVVNVASRAHLRADLDFDDLQGRRRWSGWQAYSRSKLCNVLFTRELGRRWTDTRTTANCLHPGVVRTGLGQKSGLAARLLWLAAGPFMIDAERGARTSLYVATASELSGATGGYFDDCRRTEPSVAACDPERARRLWDASLVMCGLDR